VKEMQAVIDELIEKTAKLTSEERRELIILLQEQEDQGNRNNKQNPSPNIEWLKKNGREYAGNYVALNEGDLIAFGKNIKEAATKAKEKGFDNPLLHYIPAEDEEVWGGW
jgi:hypothetical protein